MKGCDQQFDSRRRSLCPLCALLQRGDGAGRGIAGCGQCLCQVVHLGGQNGDRGAHPAFKPCEISQPPGKDKAICRRPDGTGPKQDVREYFHLAPPFS